MGKNYLHEIRRERKIRQWELAVKTGIVQSRISLVENGFLSLRPEEEKKIAAVLGVNINAIFPRKDNAS